MTSDFSFRLGANKNVAQFSNHLDKLSKESTLSGKRYVHIEIANGKSGNKEYLITVNDEPENAATAKEINNLKEKIRENQADSNFDHIIDKLMEISMSDVKITQKGAEILAPSNEDEEPAPIKEGKQEMTPEDIQGENQSKQESLEEMGKISFLTPKKHNDDPQYLLFKNGGYLDPGGLYDPKGAVMTEDVIVAFYQCAAEYSPHDLCCGMHLIEINEENDYSHPNYLSFLKDLRDNSLDGILEAAQNAKTNKTKTSCSAVQELALICFRKNIANKPIALPCIYTTKSSSHGLSGMIFIDPKKKTVEYHDPSAVTAIPELQKQINKDLAEIKAFLEIYTGKSFNPPQISTYKFAQNQCAQASCFLLQRRLLNYAGKATHMIPPNAEGKLEKIVADFAQEMYDNMDQIAALFIKNLRPAIPRIRITRIRDRRPH